MSEPDAVALSSTECPQEWTFTVLDRWCAGPHGRPFLFGGVTLAVAVTALETSTGRPLIWANAQYHDFAVPGTVIRLHTAVDVQGHRLTQARLTGQAEYRLIVTVQATLGHARPIRAVQPAEPPPVDRPEAYPVVHDRRVFAPGINNRFEFRLVAGDYPDGRTYAGNGCGSVILWVRALADRRLDRATLAIIADYVSIAVCDAAGGEVGSNSLDNTIRFVAEDDGPWVLAVMAVDAIADGVAHGGLRLFSQSGSLLAIASTSLVLREL